MHMFCEHVPHHPPLSPCRRMRETNNSTPSRLSSCRPSIPSLVPQKSREPTVRECSFHPSCPSSTIPLTRPVMWPPQGRGHAKAHTLGPTSQLVFYHIRSLSCRWKGVAVEGYSIIPVLGRILLFFFSSVPVRPACGGRRVTGVDTYMVHSSTCMPEKHGVMILRVYLIDGSCLHDKPIHNRSAYPSSRLPRHPPPFTA